MSNQKILLVDDNNGQRITLESILKRSGFDVISADCGSSAVAEVKNQDFAAALLDIKMPDLTGIDVLKKVKTKNPDTTVIMMTGYAETEYAIEALNAGASAYLLKPANIEQVKTLLSHALEHQRLIEENRAMSIALKEWNDKLEEKVRQRTSQLAKAHEATLEFYEELKKNFESTLEVLSIAIDQRDPLTYSHSFRVTQYALAIARVLGRSEDELEVLRYAGLMHDLGKIEVHEDILCKEGSLTTEEYREIQKHAQGTFDLLSKFKFKKALAEVPLIASSHHERYDGAGYPRKLKGEEIHPLGRILGVADVLDAITSKRHYRTAMPATDAISVIKRESGGQFDPHCTEAFLSLNLTNFVRIHMVDYIDRIDSQDMVELESWTVRQLDEALQVENPSANQIELIQRFYKYYQGPVPQNLAGQIQPSPIFEEKRNS